MFKIEIEYITENTCTISDEQEKQIKKYIKDHEHDDRYEFWNEEDQIIHAIEDLEINLFENDYVESDGYTNGIRWSEFEDSSAEEILNR